MAGLFSFPNMYFIYFFHLNLEIEKPGLAPSPRLSTAAPEGALRAGGGRVRGGRTQTGPGARGEGGREGGSGCDPALR